MDTASRRGIRLLLSRLVERGSDQVRAQDVPEKCEERTGKVSVASTRANRFRQDYTVDFESDIYLIFWTIRKISQRFGPHIRSAHRVKMWCDMAHQQTASQRRPSTSISLFLTFECWRDNEIFDSSSPAKHSHTDSRMACRWCIPIHLILFCCCDAWLAFYVVVWCLVGMLSACCCMLHVTVLGAVGFSWLSLLCHTAIFKLRGKVVIPVKLSYRRSDTFIYPVTGLSHHS